MGWSLFTVTCLLTGCVVVVGWSLYTVTGLTGCVVAVGWSRHTATYLLTGCVAAVDWSLRTVPCLQLVESRQRRRAKRGANERIVLRRSEAARRLPTKQMANRC